MSLPDISPTPAVRAQAAVAGLDVLGYCGHPGETGKSPCTGPKSCQLHPRPITIAAYTRIFEGTAARRTMVSATSAGTPGQ